MEIELSPAEMLQAAMAGVMRHVENTKNKKAPTYGINPSRDWQAHIEGALGECAVAKALNQYWAGKGKIGDPDVGLNLQVRTSSRDNGDLILHPGDKDDVAYILVNGLNGKYNIKGWIFGSIGKNEAYWRDPAKGRPAFFVPQDVLIPFDDIKLAMELS